MGVLRGSNSNVDQADISDAVIDAIMTVASKGVQEDATKGKLFSLLKRVSERRIIDRIRKHSRRQRRELEKDGFPVTNQQTASNVASQPVINRELVARYAPELATDEDERNYLQFWAEGFSDEEITDKLCTSNDNREQIATLVFQISQRLRQRLSRLRKRVAEEDKP